MTTKKKSNLEVVEEAVDTAETTSISKEEQKLIEIARANKKREQEAQNAILEVLQKFRVDLVVDMDAPIRKPRVKMVLLQ